MIRGLLFGGQARQIRQSRAVRASAACGSSPFCRYNVIRFPTAAAFNKFAPTPFPRRDSWSTSPGRCPEGLRHPRGSPLPQARVAPSRWRSFPWTSCSPRKLEQLAAPSNHRSRRTLALGNTPARRPRAGPQEVHRIGVCVVAPSLGIASGPPGSGILAIGGERLGLISRCTRCLFSDSHIPGFFKRLSFTMFGFSRSGLNLLPLCPALPP